MSRELPELHPSHRHQWADSLLTRWADDLTPAGTAPLVRCIVCGFEVPRNLAKLDGTPASQTPVTDKGVCT